MNIRHLAFALIPMLLGGTAEAIETDSMVIATYELVAASGPTDELQGQNAGFWCRSASDVVGQIEESEERWILSGSRETVTLLDGDVPVIVGTFQGAVVHYSEIEPWTEYDYNGPYYHRDSWELTATFDESTYRLSGTVVETQANAAYPDDPEGGYCMKTYAFDGYVTPDDPGLVVSTVDQQVRNENPGIDFDLPDPAVEDHRHHRLADLVLEKIAGYRARSATSESLRDAETRIRNYRAGRVLSLLEQGGSIVHSDPGELWPTGGGADEGLKIAEIVSDFQRLGQRFRDGEDGLAGFQDAVGGFLNGWLELPFDSLSDPDRQAVSARTTPASPLSTPRFDLVGIDLQQETLHLAWVDPAVETEGFTYIALERGVEYRLFSGVGPRIGVIHLPIGQGHDDVTLEATIDDRSFVVSAGLPLDLAAAGIADGAIEMVLSGRSPSGSDAPFALGLRFREAGPAGVLLSPQRSIHPFRYLRRARWGGRERRPETGR